MNDRARQFMPFAALKGYMDLIAEKERVKVPKRELAEDEAQELSDKISQIKKGMIITAVHYSDGEYISTEGMVSAVDFTFRTVTIVKTKIEFDNIVSLTLG